MNSKHRWIKSVHLGSVDAAPKMPWARGADRTKWKTRAAERALDAASPTA